MLRVTILTVLLAGCTTQEPPNIVYILADDLGYGELGSYGQSIIETPHLDALAERGMRFTQHYSGSPVCAPSRCTLLTGRHTGHCQVRDNFELGGFADSTERGQLPLSPGTFTLGRMLQHAGYSTAIVGKWGLGGPESTGVPNAQGFDYFYGYLDQKQAHNHYPSHLWENAMWDTLANGYFHPHQRFMGDDLDNPDAYVQYKGTDYAPDLMAHAAESFIRAHADGPFFLYLPHTVPHLALQVPDEELGRYTGKVTESPYDGSRGYLPHIRPQAAYAGMITRMDAHVGQIMAVLDELGLTDNTLVFFSSDNGPTYVGGVDTDQFQSAGSLRGSKGEVYEGGIRVPMIAAWPGRIAAGTTSDHVSAFWDVLPTLAEVTGADVAAETDGISFLPVLTGRPPVPHSEMYWEYHGRSWNGAQAARIDNWKGVRLGGHIDTDAAVEVYNLATDPQETTNLAAQHPNIAQRLLTIMQSRTPSPIERWNFAE
ncbi:MAG: arylsulfatase [Bacteroidota bacterium]|nr:arylsulfatase [Bacteroidota bacterium]